ncbi:hypothetical protein APHAL10511_003513 [Amanita phalloides]|nr:hypothetical protein APHAL10511_003513 [Amanita phalloides]
MQDPDMSLDENDPWDTNMLPVQLATSILGPVTNMLPAQLAANLPRPVSNTLPVQPAASILGPVTNTMPASAQTVANPPVSKVPHVKPKLKLKLKLTTTKALVTSEPTMTGSATIQMAVSLSFANANQFLANHQPDIARENTAGSQASQMMIQTNAPAMLKDSKKTGRRKGNDDSIKCVGKPNTLLNIFAAEFQKSYRNKGTISQFNTAFTALTQEDLAKYETIHLEQEATGDGKSKGKKKKIVEEDKDKDEEHGEGSQNGANMSG